MENKVKPVYVLVEISKPENSEQPKKKRCNQCGLPDQKKIV
jgi:hypothetical protein